MGLRLAVLDGNDNEVDLRITDFDARVTAAVEAAETAIVAAITSSGTGSDTTLEAILTELLQKLEPSDLAALATAANQTSGNDTLASILAKITADPATDTTLAAVLAKISSDPATNTTLTSVLTALTSGTTHTDLSTLHADVAAVLAKLSSDPATNTQLASLFATEHADLAAILAKDEAIRALIAGGILVSGPLTDAQLAARLPLLVESARVIAQTKFETADERNGLTATQTEALGALTRTVTYTRDTDDGFITDIDYGDWA